MGNVKMVLLWTFSLFILAVEGNNKYHNSLLLTYGCLKRSNVTLVIRQERAFQHGKSTFRDGITDLLRTLRHIPCASVFIYAGRIRKLINVDAIALQNNKYLVSGQTEVMELLENIQQQQQQQQQQQDSSNQDDIDNVRQVLIVKSYDTVNTESYYSKALDDLQKKTNYKIIILCIIYFCNSPGPAYRIFYYEIEDQQIPRPALRNLVKNPDFDRFEFAKRVKLDENDTRLKGLENKTIHISANAPYSFVENIALLLANTKFTTIKLYTPDAYRYKQIVNENLFKEDEKTDESRRRLEIIESAIRLDISQDIYILVQATNPCLEIQKASLDRRKHYLKLKRVVFYYRDDATIRPEGCTKHFGKALVKITAPRNPSIVAGENLISDVLTIDDSQ